MSVKNIVSQFVMVALCLLSLAIGTDGFNLTGLNSLIFWQSRFPRTLSIVLVGSSMSLAGLLMQSISNNKFAGPSTVGTIEAAKLGLILCLITPGITNGNKIFFSFLSAAVFTLGFITLLRQIHIKKDWMVPLFGIIYGQLLNGLGQAIAYRFGLIYQVLGFQPIEDFVIEDQRHGQSVSFEGILDLNPDRIFVIDRTQAIGSDNSANTDLVENALVKETKAYQNDQIHFLSSQLWYVSGSGLESTHLQIQEIANLMQP